MNRRVRFVYGVVGWMLGSLVFLTALGGPSYEVFFVVSLIGFLVAVELTAPFNVEPEWRRRLRWVILLGVAVFGYVVVKRILEILPSGVLG